MEMQDEHNRPKIAPKRIKLQEMTEKEEEDRISALPDCLLLDILSRLPSTKEAIKTGTLSKRWEHLWTSVSTLIFEDGRNFTSRNFTSTDFVSAVDKTLTQRGQLKLKKFLVYVTRYYVLETQVNDWIRYAIACNVEDLYLALWAKNGNGFSLDQALFTNTCFTDLTLSHCISKPIGAISWKNLKKLCIIYEKLKEDLVENILSGSPILETLTLEFCDVYYGLNITSKSIKNLELKYCHGRGRVDFDIVEIKAPNILSLTIEGGRFVSNFLLVNVSSLVEANLEYTKPTTSSEAEEVKLKRFIMNLSHIKELKIGVICSKILSRLEEKGFVVPSNIKFDAFQRSWC